MNVKRFLSALDWFIECKILEADYGRSERPIPSVKESRRELLKALQPKRKKKGGAQ